MPAYRLDQHRTRRPLPHREAVLVRSRAATRAAGDHLHALDGRDSATIASTRCWRRTWSMPARGNTAWIGDYKGEPMLFAAGAAACRWRSPARCRGVDRSAGFVGVSDGWQQLATHGRLDPAYDRAENGNVALTGEIGFAAGAERVVLALGLRAEPAEAALQRAAPACNAGFERPHGRYVAGWRALAGALLPLDRRRAAGHQHAIASAPRCCAPSGRSPSRRPWSPACRSPGASARATTTSAATTWSGRAIWSRRRAASWPPAPTTTRCAILRYLRAIQEADGHWPQNCWLDGTAYWHGIQMDECAFPILLADALWREGALAARRCSASWPMVERARRLRRAQRPGHRRGPLGGGCRLQPVHAGGRDRRAARRRRPARRSAATTRPPTICATPPMPGTTDRALDLCRRHDALRARSASRAITCASRRPTAPTRPRRSDGFVPIKNRPPGDSDRPADEHRQPRRAGAGALRPAGGRRPAHPRHGQGHRRACCDASCRKGRCWYRYNGDGYGEHADGAPFDGTGAGPALAAAGRRARPLRAGGRPPDEAREPARDAGGRRRHRRPAARAGLGRRRHPGARTAAAAGPSGSAMPLVWAHAEHIKLLRSLRDGAVFDMPPQGVEALHRGQDRLAAAGSWRFNNKIRTMPAGKLLRIELLGAGIGPLEQRTAGLTIHDTDTTENAFGIHLADLPVAGLAAGAAPSSSLSSGPTPAVGRMSTSASRSRPTTRRPASSRVESPLSGQERDHADRNDGTGPDGRQHGPPADARRP